MQDLLIILILVVCVSFVVYSMVKKKKKGISPTCGGCSSCAHKSSCGH